jgi:hypothetical protein
VLRVTQRIEGTNGETLGTNGSVMSSNQNKIIWRGPNGEVIACVEKNKVLRENLEEIRQICQDALEDAVLMGCDENQVRAVLSELVTSLKSDYAP